MVKIDQKLSSNKKDSPKKPKLKLNHLGGEDDQSWQRQKCWHALNEQIVFLADGPL